MNKRKLSVFLVFGLSASCSDAPPAMMGAAGTSASGGSGGLTAGGAAGTGSAPASGGSAPAGSAGTAGSPGTAGSVPNGGNGGAATVGSSGGGAGGSNGASGSGGVSGSGGGSGAGGGNGLLAVAADFQTFRLECPCIDAAHFGADKTDNCDSAPAVDRQTYMKTVAGDANLVYDVKLHVRGNTEPNTYVKGKLDPNDRFYVGGETSTPGYTAYMLTVSDPQQVYFFNYNPSTSHIHFLIDYEVTIPMRGGTTIKFEVNGGKSVPDGHGVSNREQLVVPGVPPAPDPFNGQFVQFDVVSVQVRP